MMLSKYISFDEMTNTSHFDLLQRNKIEANIYVVNMIELCESIVDPIREKYGPVYVDSGFRGPSLNLRIGGSSKSLHCLGKAVDLSRKDWTWEKLDEVCNWIAKESGLKWGEFIREKRTKTGGTWLHITSLAPNNEMEMWDGIDGQYTRRTI